ncbi:MAG: nucleotidyltransferase [Nitrospirota bacterium]
MDTESLLRLLKENRVDFIVIGATAFPVHGYARTTLDIDIFVKPEKKNAERVWKALKEFGYDMTDISIDDLLTKKILIRQYAVETDIHPHVKGIIFNDAWKNRVRAKYGDTFVYFASLDDLIKMKKAAGRAKDLEDLKILRNIKRMKEEKKRKK